MHETITMASGNPKMKRTARFHDKCSEKELFQLAISASISDKSPWTPEKCFSLVNLLLMKP